MLALAAQPRVVADAWAEFEATNEEHNDDDAKVTPVFVAAFGVLLGVDQLRMSATAIVESVKRARAFVEEEIKEEDKARDKEDKAPKSKKRRTTSP